MLPGLFKTKQTPHSPKRKEEYLTKCQVVDLFSSRLNKENCVFSTFGFDQTEFKNLVNAFSLS